MVLSFCRGPGCIHALKRRGISGPFLTRPRHRTSHLAKPLLFFFCLHFSSHGWACHKDVLARSSVPHGSEASAPGVPLSPVADLWHRLAPFRFRFIVEEELSHAVLTQTQGCRPVISNPKIFLKLK